MSHRITFGMDETDYAMAAAYAKDRSLEVYQVARSMLIAEVKRHVHRTGLLLEIEQIIDRRVARLFPTWSVAFGGELRAVGPDEITELEGA